MSDIDVAFMLLALILATTFAAQRTSIPAPVIFAAVGRIKKSAAFYVCQCEMRSNTPRFFAASFRPGQRLYSRLFTYRVHFSDSSHEPHIISLMPERSSHQLTG